MSKTFWLSAAFVVASFAPCAYAGPPFLTDDPKPTDYKHFEIYAFASTTRAHDGSDGDSGIDFNYGGAPDLQLTAVLPVSFERPRGGPAKSGLGNVELAAKYRFMHQEKSGVDVAFFPRVFLPSGSHLGDQHASLLLPMWIGKDWEHWSAFGGGGCAINRGDDSKDYCLAGIAAQRKLTDKLQLGAELFHQSADTEDGKDSTVLGAGATYDISEHAHFLAYLGAGLQNADETGQAIGYTSILFTF